MRRSAGRPARPAATPAGLPAAPIASPLAPQPDAARQRAHFSKRRAQRLTRLPGENLLAVDAMAVEHIERHIKLPPRRMARKAVTESGDRVGDAGIQGNRSLHRAAAPRISAGHGKQRRLRLMRVNLEIGRGRHRLVIKIEAARIDQADQPVASEMPWRASVSRNAAATGCAAASPPRSPDSTSRHHCRRISPGIGSRARSRTRAISRLKA